MNRYLDKVAGVAEDQARETIFKGNQEIRPYHNLTPEIRQALETGAVAGSAYLGSQALSHVHPGFGKAAPGVALAAGLYNATGLGSKLKASDREQERLISSLIRNRARDAQEEAKMQKSAADGGYFDAAAVGGVSGGLTGALLGGSVGVAGGEATRDARIQASNITKGVGDYINSLPFVKSNVPPIEVPSRTTAILQGVGKGVKYGLMAGVPLGASLFMYNNYKRNQESNNPYLAKIAEVTVGQTMYDDAMTGAKLGVLAGGLHGLVRGGPVRAVGEGFVGGLGGLVAGSVAGIPHGLLRDSNAQRGSRSSLLRDVQSTTDSDVRTGASIGSKVGAGLGIIGGLGAGLAGASTLMQESKVPAGKALAGALGATAALGGLGYLSGGLGGAVGGMGVAVPHGAAKSLIKDYQNNKYLNKAAEENSQGENLAGVLGAGGFLGGAVGSIIGAGDGAYLAMGRDKVFRDYGHTGSERAFKALGTVGRYTGKNLAKGALAGAGLLGIGYGTGNIESVSDEPKGNEHLDMRHESAKIMSGRGTPNQMELANRGTLDLRDASLMAMLNKKAAEDNGGGLGRMVGIGAGVGGVMGLGAGGLLGLVDHPFSTSQDTILNRLKHSGSTALKMGAGTALSSAALMGSLYGLGRYQQSHKKQAEQVWYDEPTELNKKAAEDNWRPDSYAHRLGWEDPRKAALKSAALTGLSYAPYAKDMGTGDKVMAGSMAALSASGAHSEAEMKNRILQEILEAQEHGVHHGEMDLHHQLKEDIMSDPETSKWTGRVLGGLTSAAMGGSLAHAVGGSGLAVGAGALAGGVLGGLGFGALGHYAAEADNRRVQGILDAREAYLRAKMVKKAEDEAVEHSYKPALTAGAIDAAMGLGLGALGQQISKRYLGGKYAPLVIGGLEGTAAMAATDLYQRSHEAQMAELQAKLRG